MQKVISFKEIIVLANKLIDDSADSIQENGAGKTGLALLHNALTLLTFEGVEPEAMATLVSHMSNKLKTDFEEFKKDKIKEVEEEGTTEDVSVTKEVMDIINKAKEQP